MNNKYITADTTRFFSDIDILSCINDADNQVLLVLPQVLHQAWPSRIMEEYSRVYAYVNLKSKGNYDDNELFKFANQCHDLLLRARERAFNAVEYLKKNNLLMYVDENYQHTSIKNRLSERDVMPDINSQFYMCKDKFFKSEKPNDLSKKLTLADIDAVAYGLANGILCKSCNQYVSDGTLASYMGFKNHYTHKTESYIPQSITEKDYTLYMEDRPRYLDTHPKTRILSRTTFCIAKMVLGFTPLGGVMSLYSGLEELFNILQKESPRSIVSAYQSDIKESTPDSIRSIVEGFSLYRMNVPEREYEV